VGNPVQPAAEQGNRGAREHHGGNRGAVQRSKLKNWRQAISKKDIKHLNLAKNILYITVQAELYYLLMFAWKQKHVDGDLAS
jgi:hypothetical protein